MVADNTRIHIRLTPGDDDDLIACVAELRASGESVPNAVKTALRRGGFSSDETYEDMIRRVIREELEALDFERRQQQPEGDDSIDDAWLDDFTNLMVQEG